MNFYCIQPQRHEFILLLKGIIAYCFKYQGNYHLGQMYTFSHLFKLRLSLKTANIFLVSYFWRLNEVYQATGFYSLYSIHLPQPTALSTASDPLGFPTFFLLSFFPFSLSLSVRFLSRLSPQGCSLPTCDPSSGSRICSHQLYN